MRVQSLGREDPLEKETAMAQVLFPGESQGQRSEAGCSPLGHKASDMTEYARTSPHFGGERGHGGSSRENPHLLPAPRSTKPLICAARRQASQLTTSVPLCTFSWTLNRLMKTNKECLRLKIPLNGHHVPALWQTWLGSCYAHTSGFPHP